MTRLPTLRRRSLAGAALIALVIGGASVAWACTRQPTLSLSPAFGKAGSQTQVSGRGYSVGEPVQIRWNSTAGPVLGSAVPADTAGSFSVAVTIPSSAPDGVYYIVTTAASTRGQASFQVRSITSGGSEPALSPEQTSTNGSGADSTGSNASGQTAGSTQGGTGSTAGAGTQSGELGFAEPGQTSAEATPAQAQATQPASSPAKAGQAATAAGSATAGSAATSAAGTPVAASATPAPATAGAPGQPVVGTDEQEVASARSATADLWSGFSTGNPGSLTPGLDSGAPASSGATTPLALGVGVLSAGIVALGLGFGTAELRRKRALASQGA